MDGYGRWKRVWKRVSGRGAQSRREEAVTGAQTQKGLPNTQHNFYLSSWEGGMIYSPRYAGPKHDNQNGTRTDAG